MFAGRSYILLFILSLCFINISKAQQGVENIFSQLVIAKNDTSKIRLLIQAGDIYKNKNIDTALFFYRKAIKHAELINNNSEKYFTAVCSENIGKCYYTKAEYTISLKYFGKALLNFNLLKDTLNVAKQNLNIGGAYYNLDKYDKSLYYVYQASKLFYLINDKKGEAKCYNNIGIIYNIQNNNKKALEFYMKAYHIYNVIEDKSGLALTYNNIGVICADEKDFKKALKYYNMSLELFKALKDNSGIADCNNNIGIIYSNLLETCKTNSTKRQEFYLKAHTSFIKTLKVREELNDYYGISSVYVNLADLNNKIHNYEKAIFYADNAIAYAKNFENLTHLNVAYANKAIAYDSLKNYKQATLFYKLYKQINDSIFNIEKNEQLTEMQVKFETEKKEQQIVNLQKEQQIQELEIEKQKNLNSIFILSGVSLFLIALFFYSLFYRKRKTNKILSEINAKLSNSEANLIKLNNTKDRFFSIIAHDLKSPLYSLKTSLGFFLENQDSFTKDELKRFTVSILKSVDSVSELFDNLLNWSMSETKKISFHPTEFDLSEAVKETLRLVENKACQKQIAVKSDVMQNIFVYADKNMLNFIFRNLIVNAIKFTKQGGSISIDATEMDDFVEVTVSDTGVGITPENLKKLFDNTEKISTTGTDNEKGTGLGLILCKEFVEKNKGKIYVESEINAGSKFIFTLPLA